MNLDWGLIVSFAIGVIGSTGVGSLLRHRSDVRSARVKDQVDVADVANKILTTMLDRLLAVETRTEGLGLRLEEANKKIWLFNSHVDQLERHIEGELPPPPPKRPLGMDAPDDFDV